MAAAILRVDSGKGADPYGLHPRFSNSCKFLTLSLFFHFFNKCLDTGFLPFKKMSVRLLKKSWENYSNASSPRPTCLASLLCKVLERFIDERLKKSNWGLSNLAAGTDVQI